MRFQTTDEICGHITNKILNVKDKKGDIAENKDEVMNRWREYFTDLCSEQNPVDETVLEE